MDDRLNIIFNKAKEQFPDLNFKFKDQNWFMKILGFILFFNKAFMTQYVTTIGSTIYVPNENILKDKNFLITFVHELVHVYDNKRLSILFNILYLFPQILAPLCLIGFFFHWFIGLLFLCLILPVPAYFRMYFEKRAYIVSLYVGKHLLNYSREKLMMSAISYNQQFTTGAYYFMWPLGVKADLDLVVDKLVRGEEVLDFDNNIKNFIPNLLKS